MQVVRIGCRAIGLEYRVKVGVRVRASVSGLGLLSIGVSPCFWMTIFHAPRIGC